MSQCLRSEGCRASNKLLLLHLLHRTTPNTQAEDRRAVDSSLTAAAGGLLAHVPAAISFLEDWLKADYPFKRCTQVQYGWLGILSNTWSVLLCVLFSSS